MRHGAGSDEDQLLARGDDEMIRYIYLYRDKVSEGDVKQKDSIFLATNDRL